MNTTFTPSGSARGLLLLLLMLLLGGPETWAQAPTNFDVVSIKRYRPLDQAVEYIAMFEVVFSGFIEDNTGRALGDSDFRLITTGTATGTFATISTNGNNAYVTVKDISGAGTLGIEYTGRTTSVYTGGETYESVDKRPTVLSITRRDDEKLWGGNAYPEYLVIFSEPVTGVDAADFSVALNNTYAGIYRVEEANGSNYPEYFDNNRLLGDFAHREGSQYIVTVGPVLGEGTLRLDVNATGTGIADVSGNNPLDGGFTAGESYYFDGVSPKVVSINRQAPATAVTSPGSVTFRVTFSEAVQGVDADDFGLVATGTVAGYSIGTIAAVSASVYDVTVDGITGEGTLGLKLWPGYSRTDLDRNSYGSFEAAVLALTRYYKIIYGGMATIYDFSSDNLSRTNPLGRFDLNSTAETYTITTAPPNTAPVASINPNQTATAGVAFSYTVLAFTDSETPDGLTYSASIIPANGLSFDPATRTVSGTPIGPVASTVTITATDGGGLSASTSFTLTTSCSELTASLSPNATQLSCTNPSITLTASPAGQTSYSFSAGASPIGGSSGNMATVSTGGTYSVTVTAANGCTASAQVTVSGDAADGLMTYYADADGDGFGNPSSLTTVCASTPPAGYVTNKLDCDDTRRLYADGDGDGFGAGPAVACGVANNTDCNDSMVMYADADGDGFGSTTKVACNGVANNTDCNDNLVQYADTDNDGFGSTTKVACNGVANNTDCDDTRKLYADGDKDGFGAGPAVACGVATNTDCNDNDATVHEPQTYYADADGDGFGNPNSTTTVCSSTPPTGYVTNSTDCDDTRKLYADKDRDGFGAGPAVACGVATNTDCDDNNAAIIPTIITAQPASLAVEEKQDATFSVTATGTNLTYQWYFNGTNPANELKKGTSPTLSLKGAKLSLKETKSTDAGTYYVRVTGSCGSVLSAGATLTVSSKKARLAAPEPTSPLLVTVLGNPLVGTQLEVAVKGAEGVPLQFEVIDLGGRVITQQHVEQAGAVETRRLELGAQSAGMLLLRVSTPTQSRTLRVLKVD